MQAHHTREMHITELLFEGVDKEEVPEKQITELGACLATSSGGFWAEAVLTKEAE